MYQDHPSFIQPADSALIWRYMDFTKFVALLETSSLYFVRSDKFEDPFEGSYPKLNIEARSAIIAQGADPNYLTGVFKAIRNHIAINCWHLNEVESVAMWKLYLKSNEGIAVCSTVGNFKRAIVDPQAVYIGSVRYINYETDGIDPNFMFSSFLTKRKSFEHEKEIRAIIKESPEPNPSDPNKTLDLSIETIKHGLNIGVDLNELVKSVYVSPDSPQWLFELIKSVSVRYGYDFDVLQSEMNASPLF